MGNSFWNSGFGDDDRVSSETEGDGGVGGGEEGSHSAQPVKKKKKRKSSSYRTEMFYTRVQQPTNVIRELAFREPINSQNQFIDILQRLTRNFKRNFSKTLEVPMLCTCVVVSSSFYSFVLNILYSNIQILSSALPPDIPAVAEDPPSTPTGHTFSLGSPSAPPLRIRNPMKPVVHGKRRTVRSIGPGEKADSNLVYCPVEGCRYAEGGDRMLSKGAYSRHLNAQHSEQEREKVAMKATEKKAAEKEAKLAAEKEAKDGKEATEAAEKEAGAGRVGLKRKRVGRTVLDL